MKKIVVFLLLVVISSKIAFCQNSALKSKFNTCEFNQNGFIFSIDPRIELWNTMAIVLGNPNTNPIRLAYKEEIIQHFSQYKSHKALPHLFELIRNSQDLATPFHFFLHFDKALNFDIEGMDSDLIKRCGGTQNLLQLAKEIKEFAVESGFYSFFNNHANFYNLVLSNAQYNFKDFDEKQKIEDFYGIKKHSYSVVFNIMEGSGNFGVLKKGKLGDDLYAVICCSSANGNIPSFTPDFEFYNLVYHEFSHSFCNPLVYEDSVKLNKHKDLLEPISESLEAQGYNSWLTAVHEHLVRTVSVMLAENKFGKTVAHEMFYKHELGRRFIYVKALKEKLDYYQSHRNVYKTFHNFFPELIKVFESIDTSEIAKLQKEVLTIREPDVNNIPKPYEAKWDSTMIFVVPTHEKDEVSNKNVRDFAEKLRQMNNVKIKIISDDEALASNLSANDISVFGTVKGNSFLNQQIHKLPITIADDQIVAKEIIKGTNFQIVTSWLNPYNPKKAMIIYTAQQVEDLKDYFYSPYKDGNNYWIGKNLVTITKGNYDRFMMVWTAN